MINTRSFFILSTHLVRLPSPLLSCNTFKRLPTQWLSYIIAVVVLVLSTAALQGLAVGWQVWLLVPFNAVVVSLTANGGYAVAERIKNGKTE